MSAFRCRGIASLPSSLSIATAHLAALGGSKAVAGQVQPSVSRLSLSANVGRAPSPAIGSFWVEDASTRPRIYPSLALGGRALRDSALLVMPAAPRAN